MHFKRTAGFSSPNQQPLLQRYNRCWSVCKANISLANVVFAEFLVIRHLSQCRVKVIRVKGCNAYNYFAPHVSLHEVRDGSAQEWKKKCFHYCKGLLLLQRLGNRDWVSSRISYRLVRQLDLNLATLSPFSPLPLCLLTYTRETLTDRMASKKARG